MMPLETQLFTNSIEQRRFRRLPRLRTGRYLRLVPERRFDLLEARHEFFGTGNGADIREGLLAGARLDVLAVVVVGASNVRESVAERDAFVSPKATGSGTRHAERIV